MGDIQSNRKYFWNAWCSCNSKAPIWIGRIYHQYDFIGRCISTSYQRSNPKSHPLSVLIYPFYFQMWTRIRILTVMKIQRIQMIIIQYTAIMVTFLTKHLNKIQRLIATPQFMLIQTQRKLDALSIMYLGSEYNCDISIFCTLNYILSS